MELGFIGVGRMGSGMVRRLIADGHRVVVYDLNVEAARAIDGAVVADSPEDLLNRIERPGTVWLELMEGGPTESAIAALTPHLQQGDLIIDGGTAYFKDSLRRHAAFAEQGVRFVDAGISGGLDGADAGYCLMLGGSAEDVAQVWPAVESMAVPGGAARAGGPGAGHYAKMVHNAVVYGLMQTYVEGYHLMQDGSVDIDLEPTLQTWAETGVARGYLLDKLLQAWRLDPGFESAAGHVNDSGTGRWTIIEGVEQAIPTPVLTASLYARFDSRLENTPTHRALAAMRGVVGGHVVPSAKK